MDMYSVICILTRERNITNVTELELNVPFPNMYIFFSSAQLLSHV